MIFLTILWIIVWLVALAGALKRNDLDPVTKLTWVLVIILIPVFGLVLYWLITPSPSAQSEVSIPRPSGSLPKKDYQDEKYQNEPIVCVTCKTTIPAGATACPKCGWSYLSGS